MIVSTTTISKPRADTFKRNHGGASRLAMVVSRGDGSEPVRPPPAPQAKRLRRSESTDAPSPGAGDDGTLTRGTPTKLQKREGRAVAGQEAVNPEAPSRKTIGGGESPEAEVEPLRRVPAKCRLALFLLQCMADPG